MTIVLTFFSHRRHASDLWCRYGPPVSASDRRTKEGDKHNTVAAELSRAPRALRALQAGADGGERLPGPSLFRGGYERRRHSRRPDLQEHRPQGVREQQLHHGKQLLLVCAVERTQLLRVAQWGGDAAQRPQSHTDRRLRGLFRRRAGFLRRGERHGAHPQVPGWVSGAALPRPSGFPRRSVLWFWNQEQDLLWHPRLLCPLPNKLLLLLVYTSFLSYRVPFTPGFVHLLVLVTLYRYRCNGVNRAIRDLL